MTAPRVAAAPPHEIPALHGGGILTQCVVMSEDVEIGFAHQLAAECLIALYTDDEETLYIVAVGHDELHDVVTLGVGGDYGGGMFDVDMLICLMFMG